MSTAEKAPADFHSMADHAALAMLADWRDRLDCALKAVERVARSRCNQFKSFVVIITANFAFCHLHLTCEKRRAPDQLTKLCASRNCMLLWLAPTSPVRHRLQPLLHEPAVSGIEAFSSTCAHKRIHLTLRKLRDELLSSEHGEDFAVHLQSEDINLPLVISR
jgi:hypothetical protein